MKNNKLLISFIILLATSLFLVACSDDKSTNQSDNQSKTEENSVENNNANSDDLGSNGNNEHKENSDGNKEEEKKRNEHIEHQFGLKIGKTGTVVSYTSNNLDDRISYEVTLNEVQYDEELDTHIRLFDEVFVVVDVTIKNIDDQPIDLSDIVDPGFGTLGTRTYSVPVGSEFLEDIPGLTILEGELQPGESKSGNFVFDVDKAENYHFAFGNKGDQIVTIAEWELSAEEVN